MSSEDPGSYVTVRRRHGAELDLPPPPGQAPLLLAALLIGMLLMAIQLWLITVSLDLYLSGRGGMVWQLAIASGLIFAGGLVMVAFMRRHPDVRQ